MIADPIISGPSTDEVYATWDNYKGQQCFVIVPGDRLFLSFVSSEFDVSDNYTKQVNHIIYIKIGHNKVLYNDNWISREELVCQLEECYPDHLEWLLFHPEWL